MDNEKKITMAELLKAQRPANIVNIPDVGDRFSLLYSKMHLVPEDKGRAIFEMEKFHFAKLVNDKPEIQGCTQLSLFGCLMDLAAMGLSIDPSMKHAYLVPFNIKITTPGQPDRWEKRASLMIDGRGELAIRQRQGQIKHADNPVVVYSCDKFINGVANGFKFVTHEAVHPRPADAEIIASYIRIERPDGSVDYSVMDIQDILDLKKFSKQPESLAWTAGLKGMVETKTIKHAFRSYTKIKTGMFSKVLTEYIDAEAPLLSTGDYGIEETPGSAAAPDQSKPGWQQRHNQQSAAAATPKPDPTPAAATNQVYDDFDKPAAAVTGSKVFEDDDF